MATSEPVPGDDLAINDVSRLLGVPAPTLRSWERRYGIPGTPRTQGGHRRYSAGALHELRLMRDEIRRGRRASDAARSVRALLSPDQPSSAYVQRILDSSVAMNPAGVRRTLDDAEAELGLPAALDGVLMSAMRQIGLWWQTGRCDIAQEHLTTEAARGWLSRRASFAPAPTRPRPLLFACGPRDLHTIGLEAMAVLMAYDGWSVRVLGARTPPTSLLTAARATEAAGVVVVSHLSVGRRPAVEAIRSVAVTGTPVFYAGNAFLFGQARSGVPGTYLGERLATAAEIIRAALDGP